MIYGHHSFRPDPSIFCYRPDLLIKVITNPGAIFLQKKIFVLWNFVIYLIIREIDKKEKIYRLILNLQLIIKWSVLAILRIFPKTHWNVNSFLLFNFQNKNHNLKHKCEILGE